jgi:hypothetical protein
MTHSVYQKSLSEHLEKWQKRRSRALKEEWLEAALILFRLDLDGVSEDLKQLYSSNPRGRPPFDPICMLRALLLMTLLQYARIDEFAAELRRQPRLAIIAGFQGFKTPSAGTFYLFIDRLENGPFQPKCPHRLLPAQSRKGSRLRNLKQERADKEKARKKLLSQCDSITRNLKDELLSGQSLPRPNDFQKRLEDLLVKVALIPSAQRGLLGSLNGLIICGDGSALPTGANPYGKPSCNCRRQGVFSCDHDRYYTDQTADWGYDSYRDCYYFGHTFYQHCVSTNGHDLPVHIAIAQASASDFTLSMKSLDRFQKACAENRLPVKIYAAAYDSGHDARGNYDYLLAKQIKPVIAINPRHGQRPNPTGTAQQLNDEGVPVCIAGLPMRLHSKKSSNHRIYFNCPVKRPTHMDGEHAWNAFLEQCPLGVLCQPHTKMGPVVYVRSDKDPRYYPEIARDSKEYKQIYNLRSGCERSNSAKKVTYKLGLRPCRSSAHFLMRLYLVSIVEHAKAWLAEDKKIVGGDWRKLIAASSPPLAQPA